MNATSILVAASTSEWTGNYSLALAATAAELEHNAVHQALRA